MTAIQAIPMVKQSIGDAAVTAVFGYLVVFFGLALLMAILYLMGAVFQAKAKKKQAAPAVTEIPAAETEKPLAPGSVGHVKLFDVPDKEAAMIMAVVANQMQKPLNELRFISIKEVKNDEV